MLKKRVWSGVHEPLLPKNLVQAFVACKEVLVRNKAFLAVEIFMSVICVNSVVYGWR